MDVVLIALLGYVAGAVFRTTYDYLWKAMEDPDAVFDQKFVFSMVVSVILSVMSAMVTFTSLTVPLDGSTYVFISALTTGFMVTHLVNKPISYLSKKAGK